MRSSNVGKWIGLTALVSMTAFAACGDDKVVVKDATDATSETIFSDVTQPGEVETENVQPLVRALEFNQGHGDDLQPCIGRARCTIFLGYNEEKTLELRYTEDDLPIAGQSIKFALENDANGLGRLNTLSTATNAEGIGGVRARPQQSVIGQFTVKAWIDNSTIPPKYFDVVVSPKGLVALTVVGSYNGTRPVGTYNVNLYRQNAAGVPGCDNMLDLLERQTASVSRDDLLIQQSAKFPDFDGLEADRTQKYTVFAYSKNATGEPQAWACNSTDGTVVWGESKTVELELVDRPPLYVGAYEVISRFDFSSAIPEPYATYVGYVLGFFQSPSGTVLEIACDLLPRDDGGQLNGFCNLVFDERAGGGLELSPLGGFAADLIDAVIMGLLQDTVFSTIFQVGGDVADILTAFEITSTFTFKKEPNADGVFAAGDTEENWYKVAFKWSLGANCQATEEGCGDRSFNMNAFQTAAVKGTFPASVANFFDLTIGKHSLNLKYGALINYFAEAVLLPIIVNDSTVNSYEDILGYLVGGGAECLTAQETGRDCCGVFADRTVNGDSGDGKFNASDDGATATAINAACSTIQTAAPGFLRQSLINLDLSTGDGFLIGTDGPCRLQDSNSDLKIDLIGTLTNPCVWDVEINFSDSASTTVDAVFWGRRLDQ